MCAARFRGTGARRRSGAWESWSPRRGWKQLGGAAVGFGQLQCSAGGPRRRQRLATSCTARPARAAPPRRAPQLPTGSPAPAPAPPRRCPQDLSRVERTLGADGLAAACETASEAEEEEEAASSSEEEEAAPEPAPALGGAQLAQLQQALAAPAAAPLSPEQLMAAIQAQFGLPVGGFPAQQPFGAPVGGWGVPPGAGGSVKPEAGGAGLAPAEEAKPVKVGGPLLCTFFGGWRFVLLCGGARDEHARSASSRAQAGRLGTAGVLGACTQCTKHSWLPPPSRRRPSSAPPPSAAPRRRARPRRRRRPPRAAARRRSRPMSR